MKKRILFLFTGYIFLAMIFIPATLLAAPYYEGKVMVLLVGHGPGGGFDRITRILARYLPKYIPGKPVIIVKNMPGAGTLIAANHLYNVAKPNGLTIGLIDRGVPFAQLLKAKGIEFDLRKFIPLGAPFPDSMVLAVRPDLPYKTYDDLKNSNRPIYFGASGPATTDYQYPAMLKEFLKLNFKIVIYDSSSQTRLAIQRKEVDGKAGSFATMRRDVEEGSLRAVIRCRVSVPGIEDLQVDEELTTSEVGKKIMAMRTAPDRAGRCYLAPPGTPKKIVNILRNALAKAYEDPKLRADFKKQSMSVQFVPGDEYKKMIDFVLNQPEDIIKEFSKYIKF
ncbi:tripartite tricarboxylate transporter substrate-binding protein [Thermodesulfobacteriota bacterium]